jgi:nicotinate-nucleotide adenylyltransferase
MKPISSVALFGGTFDPFHNGHLMIISVLEKLSFIDKIVVIPNCLPPHKESPKVSAKHRLAMLRLFLNQHIGKPINLDMYEYEKKATSWTIDTIDEYIKQNHLNSTDTLDSNLYYVIGSDSYFSFHKWREYKNILQKVKLIVLKREAIQGNIYKEYYKKYLFDIDYDKFVFLDNEIEEVSSTEIRNLINKEKDISSLVPNYIFKYIQDNNLYLTSRRKQ